LVVAERRRELEEEQAVARDVRGLVGRSQLFDEEDRRLLVVRQDLQPAQASGAARSGPESDPSTDSNDSEVGATPGVPASPVLATGSAGHAPAFAQTEQGFFGPQTDSGIAGLLSSPSVSADELRALEVRLRADARVLRAKSRQLKAEAQSRARD
jgi:hypothetical protein